MTMPDVSVSDKKIVLFSGLNTSAITSRGSFKSLDFRYIGSGEDNELSWVLRDFYDHFFKGELWKFMTVELAEKITFLDYSMAEKILERHSTKAYLGEYRRSLILGAIGFWYSFLEKENYNAVVHGTASPHGFWNYTLSVAAKTLGINQWTISADFITRHINLIEYPGIDSLGFSDHEYDTSKLVDFCLAQADRVSHPTYISSYLLSGRSFSKALFNILLKRNLKLLFHDVVGRFDFQLSDPKENKLILLARKFFRDLNSLVKLKKLRSIYIDNAEQVGSSFDNYLDGNRLSNDRVVVFFASFQPEATTTPDAGHYNNAKMVIAELLKNGYEVFYKEHPVTFSYDIAGSVNNSAVYKDRSFYEDLKRAGVRLLSPELDNRSIISTGCRIVTCTGTIGLQGALNGCPVLLLGRAWYGFPPGTVGDLDKFLNLVGESDPSRIIEYLQSRWGNGIKNVVGVMTGKAISCSDSEQKFFEGIEKAILVKTCNLRASSARYDCFYSESD
ncbi:hypothetical protein [Marinobacter shengliensis]|uniref:hypothetical protein n=1 Tax=Marinobacter shengliensis TaxID=1389223 RepID=UPI0035B9CE94